LALLQEYAKIIKPEGFAIPKEAFRVHGITTEKANREGELLVNVLSWGKNGPAREGQACG
jgi:DNA polymerase III epsilon subunit-like protein